MFSNAQFDIVDNQPSNQPTLPTNEPTNCLVMAVVVFYMQLVDTVNSDMQFELYSDIFVGKLRLLEL